MTLAAMTVGPTLEQYLETRLNLLITMIQEQGAAHTAALLAFGDASKTAVAVAKAVAEAAQLATDLRYQQRFEAQSDALTAAFLSQQTAMQTAFVVAEKAVQAALAAADRAVSKAELAADKRFESVNEFRKTLDDQQRTLMPRAESDRAMQGITDKLTALKEQVDSMLAERLGIKGGWGYAAALVGFVVALGALFTLALKFLGR